MDEVTNADQELDDAPEALDDAVVAEAKALLGEIEAGLAGIEAALSRLEEGNYGSCEVCGTAIDAELLNADPTLVRCAAHSS